MSKELEDEIRKIKNRYTYTQLRNLEVDIKTMNNKKKELEQQCSYILAEEYMKFIEKYSKDGQVALSDVEKCMKLLAWEVYMIGKESK